MTLLIWPILAKIYFSYTAGIIKENFSAAWLVVLLGCLVAFIWYLPLGLLLKRFPGQDLVSMGEMVLGPLLGKLVTGLVVVYFFFSTALVLRQIAEAVIGTALPQVPLLVIIVVFTFIMSLTTYWGLESTARTASLLTPFLLIGGIGMFLLQSGNMKFDYLAPFWGPGLSKLAVHSFERSSILSEMVLLGFLAPMLPRKKTFSVGLYIIVISTVILTGAMVIGQTIFPPAVAAENAYPFYEIARSIYFGRFFQRFEHIFVVVWLTITLLSLSVRFYFSTVGFARVFKMPYYQPLVIMMALAVLGVALIFPNFSTTIYLDNLIQGHWTWVPAFLIPFMIYITALLRGKRGTNNEETD